MRRRVSYRDHIHGRNPQNELPASRAGAASQAGPRTSGPGDAPFPDEETGELPGADVNEPGEAAIPAAGTGGQSKPGARGGALAEHAQNAIDASRAGTGADGKGHAGGGHQARGGHAQNAALPAKKAKQPNPVGADRDPRGRTALAKGKPGTNKTTLGARNNLGHFLGRVATGTKRPI